MEAIARDWKSANLEKRPHALCAFAEKVTRTPNEVKEADLAPLRAAGLDDRGIHDAVQVIAYFNYINRVADSLGIDPEDGVRPWGTDAAGPAENNGA